jgi:ACT domain-containing protein
MYGGINADEEKIANLFGKLSNSSEYYALKDLVNQSYELNKERKDYKKLGIEKPSFYNFQDMINKVYDSAFDKSDANLLVNNLNKIGVKAKIKQSGSGNFAGITMP